LRASRHFDSAEFRHPDVQNKQVRMLLFAEPHRLKTVRRLGDDRHPGGFEQPTQAAPDDTVIVSQ
jgi:hypothetical protein